MKLITFEDIASERIPASKCYEWVSDAIVHKKEALLPAKISLKPEMPGVFYNTMPVVLPGADYAGVKLVTRYPERKPSLESNILLYRLSSGECLALMDGTWVTTMRTGAVAAHSISLLAKPNYSVLGFIGLGNTARATLLTLVEMNPDKQFEVKLKKYKDQHDLFMKRFSGYPNLSFALFDDYSDVVSGSDVVVSAATVLDHDICDDECFDPGVLLVPVHTRGFGNCDLFFDKVFADDTGHVSGFKYFDRFNSFAEVSDVVLGKAPGRESDEERIIAYNIGISLHDIYFAGKLYEFIGNKCTNISMEIPEEK